MILLDPGTWLNGLIFIYYCNNLTDSKMFDVSNIMALIKQEVVAIELQLGSEIFRPSSHTQESLKAEEAGRQADRLGGRQAGRHLL